MHHKVDRLYKYHVSKDTHDEHDSSDISDLAENEALRDNKDIYIRKIGSSITTKAGVKKTCQSV